MSIPSKEYWAQRALKRETESMQACAELTDKLFREYEAAARVIRRDIADFYARYGEKHGLSYEESIRTLSREEMREWKATLSEYVAKIATETDPEVKKKLTAQLDALSMNSRITRLEALEGQIDLILNDLYDKGVSQMKEEFGDMFTESYYKKCYDIQSRRGFFNEIAKISPEEVEHVLSYPWSGAMFSDRLWQNKQTLIYSVREILTQGVIQGKSIDAMTQALAGKMGQSYKAAERLIRTETNYIHNESSRAAYNAAGIEKYEFMASLNERTCEMCGELDGKVFLVKDAVAGTNYPPIHPNCRCTTVEYDAEDVVDNIASGEPMPKNMTYTEWKKRQEEKSRVADPAPIAEKSKMLESIHDKQYNSGVEIDDKQFGKKVKHVREFGLDIKKAEDREKLRAIIQDIVINRDEIVQGMWRGQGELLPSGNRADGIVDFIVKGNDIVVAKDGKFISILKDGVINNTRFKNAKRRKR